jgi:hypothetical protein
MPTDAERYNLKIGDRFPDIRDGYTGDVTIIDIIGDGNCFQVEWTGMGADDPRPYLSLGRLSLIAGIDSTEERASLDAFEDELLHMAAEYPAEELIPAETFAVHVDYLDTGDIRLTYFAHAHAWSYNHGTDPRTFRNEAQGHIDIKQSSLGDIEEIARNVSGQIAPYRLSPSTSIEAKLFPSKRPFLDRLKLAVFGGPCSVAPDSFTSDLDTALREIGQRSVDAHVTVMN